ncbi:ABC transporter permease subunit [Thalassotalea sp. PLHSN55]|uniref:ABC transporter permease subunit n=1 Tax=Thalassotalea sp. PLHSN55 TaxID=3435888 RepID=UPI003F82C7E4
MALLSFDVNKRQFKNKLAQWLITLGGVSVLFTLILIFLYLLYVIKPIFESATVEPVTQLQLASNAEVLTAGSDELSEVAYTLDKQGQLNFYQAKQSDFREVGAKISSYPVSNSANVELLLEADTGQTVLTNAEDHVFVFESKFTASYIGDQRDIAPSLNYPLGEDSIEVDEQGARLTQLAFAMNEETAVFVGFTQDKRLIKTTLVAEDDFNYDPEFEAIYQEIDFNEQHVDDILISPDLTLAFVRVNDIVSVFELDDEYSVTKRSEIDVVPNNNYQISSMSLLSGGSSLLFGDSRGKVSQWFEVSTEQGRLFKQVRDFEVSDSEAVVEIHTEQFRKSFFTLTPSGEMGVFYTTSDADLWRGEISSKLPHAFGITPRANGLVIVQGQELQMFAVENEHPEVTWNALWQEVWYEGYPEPDYIWQSTSGSDDFEAKFSLVPISFGTIKAALYAMLFAVPIAITAAIYTAYFMTPGLRKKVKPTIELMEALPTVILGFLAGLWLAPIIENYLPAMVLLLIFLPVSTLITAFLWHNLSQNLKNKIPETLAPIILLPVLMLAAYCAFALSPVLEVYFFGGDMRQFITNDLGISFDQRNALVVGIAMGFAVIPTIFSMAEDAIFSVPKHLTSGSLALGATPWQTLIKVVLLTASPGIFSAIMMGLGRAVGETMIVLMATGNTPILDWSIFQGMRTLAANIAVEMPESEVGSSHYRILFLAAFVLFVFTFVFNTLAEFVRQRLREKYSSL